MLEVTCNKLQVTHLGSHFTIWLAGSKQALVISATLNCSWYAFSAEITGAYVTRGKWILEQYNNQISKKMTKYTNLCT